MAPSRPSRRRVLLLAAGLAAWSGPLRAAPLLRTKSPRLQLVNAHTGETFDGPYRDERAPLVSAMSDLSAFLRDFHCGAQIAMDVGVIDFLAAVIDAVAARSATILSAYRTPETNAMLARTTFGVAEHSQHMYGRALDIRINGDLAAAMRAARAMERGGVGWYPRSGFLHIDSGPVRNWNLDEGGLVPVLTGRPGRELHAGNPAHPKVAGGDILPRWANSGRPLPTLRSRGRLLPGIGS